jgi:hypothetical protein
MSSVEKPKKMGRPPKPEGQAVLLAGKVSPAIAAAVDVYARKERINRSEAIRRLVELGLRAKGKTR